MQPADEDQQVAQRDGNRRADDRQDQRGVGRDPAEHLAGHHLLEERRAHADHAVEHRLADVGHDALAKAGDQRVAQPGPDREQERDAECRGEILIQNISVLGVEVVDDPAHGKRQRKGDDGRRHEGCERREHQATVGPDEGCQRAERTDPLRLFALFRFARNIGRWGLSRGHQQSFEVTIPSWQPMGEGSRHRQVQKRRWRRYVVSSTPFEAGETAPVPKPFSLADLWRTKSSMAETGSWLSPLRDLEFHRFDGQFLHDGGGCFSWGAGETPILRSSGNTWLYWRKLCAVLKIGAGV